MTDNSLLNRFIKGDHQAFTDIYDQYHNGIYNYLLKFTKNPALTKDLLQDIFLKLWEVRGQLTTVTSLSAYLYRFARNKAINQLSQLALHDSIREEIMHRMKLGIDAQTWRNNAEWKQYEEILNRAVASLPPQRREAFVLCRQQGKTYEEACAEMNISRNTLKQHLGLAVISIKKFLKEHGDIVLFFVGANF